MAAMVTVATSRRMPSRPISPRVISTGSRLAGMASAARRRLRNSRPTRVKMIAKASPKLESWLRTM